VARGEDLFHVRRGDLGEVEDIVEGGAVAFDVSFGCAGDLFGEGVGRWERGKADSGAAAGSVESEVHGKDVGMDFKDVRWGGA
jgi:hypothetical protein